MNKEYKKHGIKTIVAYFFGVYIAFFLRIAISSESQRRRSRKIIIRKRSVLVYGKR